MYECPYENLEMIDEVFIYLLQEETDLPICYWSAQCTEFLDPNPDKSRWCILKADQTIGVIKNDYEAGAIQLKLVINDL